MGEDRKIFGQAAERAAEHYLRRKGYQILGRNVRLGGGELDLIARKDGTLVFVEVKARTTERYGGARYAVNRQKESRLIRLAAQFVARNCLTNQPCRFDVVLCRKEETCEMSIEHIENAFEVPADDLRW